jgi:selenocysteine-specific elongation factor
MILGTAGHVDHGKTALVKALTGVDTDRLAEEKRRGITIDLGFAPLLLDGGVTLGVVDVPGHEAFVRNMLAGATGIDLALLVVAADEGVMPQTREHLAILALLGIRGGVIALTKSDLAEPEWLDLVAEDVRAAVSGTPLADAQLVPTSVTSGAGIAELRAAIAAAAGTLPGRADDDLFRLPVDRAFTVRGTGTVVTGTVWSGTLRRDQSVRLLPGERRARVRGIESHGQPLAAAVPGTRAAIALAAVDLSDVRRGSLLVSDESWQESSVVLADVKLLEAAPQPLGPRTRVRFHLGAAEVGARVITAGGQFAPGGRRQARLTLDSPIVARAGDRFVLRSASPLATIGGGVIEDPAPLRPRPRPWPSPASDAAERLQRALEGAGAQGVPVASLPVRLGIRLAEIEPLLGKLGASLRRVGDRVFASAAVAALAGRLVEMVEAYHERAPLELGAPLQETRARLGAEDSLVEYVLRETVRNGAVVVNGGVIARSGWSPTFTASQEHARTELLHLLAVAGREPPSVGELESRARDAVLPLLRNLERSGLVVQVEGDRFYERSVLDGLAAELRSAMAAGREYSPAELRDILGVSRKYLIPLLEFFDRTGVTERRPTGRVLADRVMPRTQAVGD